MAITFRTEKTRMTWLPDGEKILKIYLFVSTEYTNVTNTQMDGRTPHYGTGRANASHRAAKIQLNCDFQLNVIHIARAKKQYLCPPVVAAGR